MGNSILETPELLIEEEKETEREFPWNVILYNDNHHTFNEVVLQVQKATGVALNVAFEITMEAHTKGQAICFTGTHTECEKVAGVLREIGLTVEIVPAEG